MSSNEKLTFNKENLNLYLKEVAKEYRRINGKYMPAEIILVGGASILANYSFRDMTTDMDAIIQASSAMKEAINNVGDKYSLPNGWLNSDFIKTDSYSHKLREISKHYKTFSNIVEIRTVSGEYLIAMKLRSGRKYRNDLFDVIGILKDHIEAANPITYEQIEKAVIELYGSWEVIPLSSKEMIRQALNEENLNKSYEEKIKEEKEAKEILVDFQTDYPGVLKKENLEDVLKSMREKREKLKKSKD